jgi:hypothetical protein
VAASRSTLDRDEVTTVTKAGIAAGITELLKASTSRLTGRSFELLQKSLLRVCPSPFRLNPPGGQVIDALEHIESCADLFDLIGPIGKV